MTDARAWFVQTATGVLLDGVVMEPEQGSGAAPVLLVHGSGVGYRCFDVPTSDYSLMSYLVGEGHCVYAVDQRGYGVSSNPGGLDVRAATSAADLLSVLRAIRAETGAERVGLVGHSWGGIVAAIMAARWPDEVGPLVLIGCPYQRLNREWAAVAGEFIALAKAGECRIPNRHALDVERKLCAFEQEVVDAYRSMVNEKYPTMPAGVFLDLEDLDFSRLVPSVVAPTLLVVGQKETVVDPEDAYRFLEALGSNVKELLFIGDAAHLTFLEKEGHRQLNRAVAGWL
jgi:pimeloyl-ACP methyl ester carboxylesterase